MSRLTAHSFQYDFSLFGIAQYLVAFGVFAFTSQLLVDMFFRGNKFIVDGRTVVITGGSQGMGRGIGKLLAAKGANVVLVARNVQKLKEAVSYISAAAKYPEKQRFHFIAADVTSPAENQRLLTEATAWNGGQPPDIVWANAGASAPQLFLDASVDTLRSQMDINYWAAVYLAQETLKAWLKHPGQSSTSSRKVTKLPRHFVMTSSTVAFCGVAGYVPYSPAKSALRSFHDTLRSELNLYNGAFSKQPAESRPPQMKIATVFPGTILSPGYEQENQSKHPVTKELEKGDPKQTEDEVAKAAVSELEAGRAIISTQLLGTAMRASALGGSARDRMFVDTFLGWITYIVFLFVAPDMENTVWKWGAKNGLPSHAL